MCMLIVLNIIYLINHNMYKMGITKEINIKNRNYYFYNDIINLVSSMKVTLGSTPFSYIH